VKGYGWGPDPGLVWPSAIHLPRSLVCHWSAHSALLGLQPQPRCTHPGRRRNKGWNEEDTERNGATMNKAAMVQINGSGEWINTKVSLTVTTSNVPGKENILGLLVHWYNKDIKKIGVILQKRTKPLMKLWTFSLSYFGKNKMLLLVWREIQH